MKNKLRVGILFGGKSAEHEISLQSAKNVFDALDRDKYEPVLIGIDKSGRWLLNDEQRLFLGTDDPACLQLNPASDEVTFVLGEKGELANLSANKNKQPLDVVFPILHGPFGEDGTVQGFLKLAEIPFVGAGVLASSVSMDKDVMKRLLRDAGLPIGKFRPLSRLEKAPVYESLCQSLGSPFFVKPANMGSSVGISKVRSADEYLPALNLAFEYDNKVVIEEYISGRELECSVLGNEEVEVSVPGEIKSRHEFYSYDAKYIDEHGAELIVPAGISLETSARLKELSARVFKTLCCEGLARVDFFLKEDGTIFVNEINTMPGFTKISMYPKLWEASGLSYAKLIDRLIELSLLRHERDKKIKTSF